MTQIPFEQVYFVISTLDIGTQHAFSGTCVSEVEYRQCIIGSIEKKFTACFDFYPSAIVYTLSNEVLNYLQ